MNKQRPKTDFTLPRTVFDLGIELEKHLWQSIEHGANREVLPADDDFSNVHQLCEIAQFDVMSDHDDEGEEYGPDILDWDDDDPGRIVNRIGAAFHLWPYFSVKFYFAEMTGNDIGQRLKARKSLCRIQQILYLNIRKTLDYFRAILPLNGDHKRSEEIWLYEQIGDYVDGDAKASKRSHLHLAELVDPSAIARHIATPVDICAADSLIVDMLKIMSARGTTRKAMEVIHHAGLTSTVTAPSADDVKLAFQSFGVGHLEILFNDTPEDTTENDSEIDIRELVHVAEEELSDDAPAQLVPFDFGNGNADLEQTIARNYRRLVDSGYTNRNDVSHRAFGKARFADMKFRRASVEFFPGGEITAEFLGGFGNRGAEGAVGWPRWFKRTLEELDEPRKIVAWDKHTEIWQKVEVDDLIEKLFPGSDEVNRNHHKAAFADYLASKYEEYRDKYQEAGSVSDPLELIDSHQDILHHCTSRTDGGLRDTLHEKRNKDEAWNLAAQLMLREHSEKARTAFVIPILKTHESLEHERRERSANGDGAVSRDRLALFIRGSFLGLERPGIPFERKRFETYTYYFRAVLMALSVYCHSHIVRRKRAVRIERRKEILGRERGLVELFAGTGEFAGDARDGAMLLCQNGADHDLKQGSPSFEGIRRLFRPQCFESTDAPEQCRVSWKSLLMVPLGMSEAQGCQHDAVKWLSRANRGEERRFNRTQKVKCRECLIDAFAMLLGQKRRAPGQTEFRSGLFTQLQVDVDFKEDGGITFPSRPGIRFLESIARFVSLVQQWDGENRAEIRNIRFRPFHIRLGFSEGSEDFLSDLNYLLQVYSGDQVSIPSRIAPDEDRQRVGRLYDTFLGIEDSRWEVESELSMLSNRYGLSDEEINWVRLLCDRRLRLPAILKVAPSNGYLHIQWTL